MVEMQENFQQKLRSMRNLCCVVWLGRWYTDGECSDPALYVNFAMHAVRTSKCNFFLFCANRHQNRTPKSPVVPGPHRVYSSTCDVC